jgi:hypothetical protein
MANHYSYIFQSNPLTGSAGTKWKVKIHDTTYAGTDEVTLFPNMEGFTLNWEGAQSETYQPFIISTFNCGLFLDANTRQLISDLNKSSENRFLIVVYRWIASAYVRQWQGVIMQDEVVLPDSANGDNVITLTATDGLGLLQDAKYTYTTGQNKSIIDYLAEISTLLKHDKVVGIGEELWRLGNDWKEDSATGLTDGNLANFLIPESAFAQMDDYGVIQSMSYYEILEQFLITFNLQISQWNGVFLLIQQNTYNEIETRPARAYNYNYAGTYISVRAENLFETFPDRFTGGTYSFILPAKETSCEYDFKRGVINGNLLPFDVNASSVFQLGYINLADIITTSGTIETRYTGDSALTTTMIRVEYRLHYRNGSNYCKQNSDGSLEWTANSANYIPFFSRRLRSNGAAQIITDSFYFELPSVPSNHATNTFYWEFYQYVVFGEESTPFVPDGSEVLVYDDIEGTIKVLINSTFQQEGIQLFKSHLANNAKAAVTLVTSVIGDGPNEQTAGSIKIPGGGSIYENSNLWTLADLTAGTKYPINSLRCLEIMALRRFSIAVYSGSFFGLPNIHAGVNWSLYGEAQYVYIWTSISFNANAMAFNGSLMQIHLDRSGITVDSVITNQDTLSSGSGAGGTNEGSDPSSHERLHDINSVVDHSPAATSDKGKYIKSNPSSGNIEFDSITGLSKYHGVEASGTLSFNATTHVFSIASITYWFEGLKFVSAVPVTVDIDTLNTIAANTLYFIYFTDGVGTITCTAASWDIKVHVLIATIFWNGTAGAIQAETHSYLRNREWHVWAHDTIGTRYEAGLVLVAPTTVNDNALSIESGTLHDEDIDFITGAQTVMRGWRLVSATVYTFDDYAFPFLGTTGNPQYVDIDAGYILTDVPNNDYVCYWVYAANDIDRPIYFFATTANAPNNTIANARLETAPNLIGFSINSEMKLIYKFIYKGDGQFQESTDYRTSSPVPGGGTSSMTAASVSFIPAGTIAATNVQTAIQELDSQVDEVVFYGRLTSAVQTSSITLVDITGLSHAIIEAGSYQIEVVIFIEIISGIANGSYYELNFSGTTTNINYSYIWNPDATALAWMTFNNTANSETQIACSSAGNAKGVIQMKGIIEVSTTGTLKLKHRLSAYAAINDILKANPNSFFKIIKL